MLYLPMTRYMPRSLWRMLLYSNALYGLAAVLLAMEAVAQLALEAPPFSFYLLLGAGTTAFYTFSYRYDGHAAPSNLRAVWIARHIRQLFYWQWVLVALAVLSAGMLYLSLPVLDAWPQLGLMAGMGVFPLLALLYYGVSFPGVLELQLRQIGWLKPFTISLVWVGCTAVVPLLLSYWQQPQWLPAQAQAAFGVHSLMYIAVLCILFDIKDYAADHNQQLQTLVVRVGLRKTLYRIVLPLVLIGMLSLVLFMGSYQYSLAGIVLNLVPMLLLLWVMLLMRSHRSIDFYLLIIDGLMPVKAICGIGAAWLQ